MKKLIFLILIFNALSCSSELSDLRKKYYLTDNEEQEIYRQKKAEEEKMLEQRRIDERLKKRNLESSIEQRFNNIDSKFDYFIYKKFHSYISKESFWKLYAIDQFEFFIRSEDIYINDSEIISLYKDEHGSLTASYISEDYHNFKEDLYYFKIGKHSRVFNTVEYIQFNILNENIALYENSNNYTAKYNYNKLVEFLKDKDIRDAITSHRNEVFDRYN